MPKYIAWSEDFGDQPPETWDSTLAAEHDCAADAATEYLLSRPEQFATKTIALVSVMDDTAEIGDYRVNALGIVVPRNYVNYLTTGERGEGFDAFHDGYSLLDNPYRPGNKYHRDWEAGWRGAERQHI